MSRIVNGLLMILSLAACLVPPVFMTACDKSPSDPDIALFDIRLTEIHYNPLDTDGFVSDSLEFVELKNIGISTIDIGSLEFTGGIDYKFPIDAILKPDSFFVIASNRRAFIARYGFAPSAVYKGQLKNSQETIVLTDALTESVIISQTYADTNGWPEEPDGKGYSLVPTDPDPARDATGPESWRKSATIHGSPGADDILLPVDPTLFNLRITEILYHPVDSGTFHEDSLEFIELKNIGSSTISLERVAFTKGISYSFAADAKLDPGSFVVLASGSSEFRKRYNMAPFAVYTGRLSNSGDKLVLEDIKAATPIITIEYSDNAPWPEAADGDGYSLVPYNSNPDINQNNPAAWRTSSRIHGSPGIDDPGIVIVNEVLSNTDAKETVELYNPGNASVDISGWFLTDRKSDPVKFIIPQGTVVGPGSYIQFTEDDFASVANAVNPFSLSAHGDGTYIMTDSIAATQSGYWQGFRFGELEKDISYGRYITKSGREVFTAQNAITLGEANSGPRIGPLIISEIMYMSSDGKGDFIEITNISLQEVRLYDPQTPQNTWKLDGISFSFPVSTTIKSGESIVIISNLLTVDDFKNRYLLSDSVKIFIMQGTVPDSGKVLSLFKPEEPYINDSSVTMTATIPYMTIDMVEYSERSPWPTDAANGTMSLQRIEKTAYGDDYTSWKAAMPTPGRFQ